MQKSHEIQRTAQLLRFSVIYRVGGPKSIPHFTPETGMGSRAKNLSFKRVEVNL
jgi:hypothetical protein